MKAILVVAVLFIACAAATVHYKENFGAGWESRWVQSAADDSTGTAGKFAQTAGKYYGGKANEGVQTSVDARFYKYSSKFDKVFNNEGKPLVLQYTVKHEQNLDCGGDYLKIAPPGLDQKNFNGDSTYNIMFGPDKCGSTNRVHFIFNYKGKNHLWKKTVVPPADQLTHLYTAIVNADQTYEVRIDNEIKESGSILEDWDLLPPKMINDPAESKPADWVDAREIPDPEATKPEGWDDIPKEIVDPEATKPEDWDDSLDGTWEAPTKPNPDYKGEWFPTSIPNPAYKGEWVHPQIPNPDYVKDDKIGAYENEFAAFEIWQVKSGSVYGHILVSDSVEDAEAAWAVIAKEKEPEEEMYNVQQKEQEAAQQAERDAKLAELEEEEGEDEDDDDEEAAHDEL